MDSLYENIPQRLLPQEYGGDADSMDKLAGVPDIYNIFSLYPLQILVLILKISVFSDACCLPLYKDINWSHSNSRKCNTDKEGPRKRSRYNDSLRAGRSGDRIPAGSRFSALYLERPWGQNSLLYKGYRVFPGDKAAGSWR
jgi:hypothetical protein